MVIQILDFGFLLCPVAKQGGHYKTASHEAVLSATKTACIKVKGNLLFNFVDWKPLMGSQANSEDPDEEKWHFIRVNTVC